MKVCTWNIGCFSFLKYAKYLGIKFNGQKILHEYFQPKINGDFVSENIEKLNPDIIFLQEFYYPEDVEDINFLKNYPYKKFVHAWYHKHSILIASKIKFEIYDKDNFSIISCKGLNFIPIHLNSFSAQVRFKESVVLTQITDGLKNLFILGDSNIWSRGNFFFFKNDKKAYKNITEKLKDFSKEVISTTYAGLGLDKVFGSSQLLVFGISSPKIRSYFMDHYPVVFDVKTD